MVVYTDTILPTLREKVSTIGGFKLEPQTVARHFSTSGNLKKTFPPFQRTTFYEEKPLKKKDLVIQSDPLIP